MVQLWLSLVVTSSSLFFLAVRFFEQQRTMPQENRPITRRAALTSAGRGAGTGARRASAESGMPADFPKRPINLILPLAPGRAGEFWAGLWPRNTGTLRPTCQRRKPNGRRRQYRDRRRSPRPGRQRPAGHPCGKPHDQSHAHLPTCRSMWSGILRRSRSLGTAANLFVTAPQAGDQDDPRADRHRRSRSQ